MTPRASQDTKDMENPAPRILVVDDEEAIREGVRDYRTLEGYRVDSAPDALRALARGVAAYDLILLDIMMDHLDGFQMAGRLKADPQTAHIPIIFLTARDTDDDMVAGLSLGADDYIAKPFSMRNLIARIQAVLRRTHSATPPSSILNPHCSIHNPPVRCDRAGLRCTVDSRPIHLPRKEFEILALLLENPGRIFTREELMRRIWPDRVVVTDRSVDVHITRLRAKIAPYSRNIVSRSGYGYGWLPD